MLEINNNNQVSGEEPQITQEEPDSLTEEVAVTIDPERQEKARQYARISRRLMVVDLALGGIYVLAWLFLGWSAGLRDFILQYTTNDWLLVAGYALIFFGIMGVLSLPLSYYEGFVLPHRYGISNQTLRGWISDLIKGGLVGGVLGLVMLEIIYLLLRLAPETWWLWTAAILLLFSVILTNLAPVLFFPLFYKFEPLGEEYAELTNRLHKLAEGAGTRLRGVFRFDMSRRTSAANAALAGLGNTRRILLGDTLLDEFTSDEIETIMAHELGHHVHKDLPLGILVESVMTLVGLWLAGLGLAWGVEKFGFSSVSDIAALPLFMLVMSLYSLLTSPITNGFSRWRERRADAYAVEVTGKGAAFASALARLANQNLSDADPEKWVVFFLYSHPPLKERMQDAQ